MGVEKRRHRRRQVAQPALIVSESGDVVGRCTMLDVSASGARLKLETKVELPSSFVILLSMYHPTTRRQCSLAWKNGTDVGIRFPETPATLTT